MMGRMAEAASSGGGLRRLWHMSSWKKEEQQKLNYLWYLLDNDQESEFKREIEANPELLEIAGQFGNTILCTVVGARMQDLAQWLLERGAEVNVEGCSETPLQKTISIGLETGSYEFFHFLLDHGADIEFRGFNTWTALITACTWGAIPAVKILLERGADVNARSLVDGGWTSLMYAANAGPTEIVEMLLRHGARTDIRCEFSGKTAEKWLRAHGGSTRVLRELENWSCPQDEPKPEGFQ
jgi:ankyrin repeat protein